MELRSAGYPAPPGLHAQRGCSAWGPFRGSPTRSPRLSWSGSAARWRSPLPGGLPRARFGPMVRVDHRVASRSAHIAVGAGHGRRQARGLSIWAPGPGREPPSGHMCAPVPAQPQRRGVSDRRGGTSRTGAKRAGECDGLTGLPEAIEATWPQATVQTCVVHLIRASMRFVSYGDRRKVAAALKADLHRPEPGGRLAGSDRLLRVRHGGSSTPRR